MALGDGSVMRLTFDGKEIFHEVSVNIGGSKEFKEAATKDVDSISIPGKKTTDLGVEGILSYDDPLTKAAVKDIVDAWNDDTLAAYSVTDGVSTHIAFSGNAYISDWRVTAQNDEFITFSYSLKPSGDLVVSENV